MNNRKPSGFPEGFLALSPVARTFLAGASDRITRKNLKRYKRATPIF